MQARETEAKIQSGEILACWACVGELWNTGEQYIEGWAGGLHEEGLQVRQRAASGAGALPGQGWGVVPSPGAHSLDKTIWLLLTLFSALTVAALLPPNALASLCLRNLAHLGHPSPKPTSPWNLLPPSLHSPMRAASGHTPAPLPGITVARQPRVRYLASLGSGGRDGAVWDKDPGKGQGRALGLFPQSFPQSSTPSGPWGKVSQPASLLFSGDSGKMNYSPTQP